jgi:hypothetical protein
VLVPANDIIAKKLEPLKISNARLSVDGRLTVNFNKKVLWPEL